MLQNRNAIDFCEVLDWNQFTINSASNPNNVVKKHSRLKIAGLIVGIFLVSIVFLVLLMAIADDIKDTGRARKNAIDCFAGAATSCGNSDNTEGEIRDQINSLNLSTKKAREVILDAQEEHEKYLEELQSKKELTERERKVVSKIEKDFVYYQRVLETIDKMEKE